MVLRAQNSGAAPNKEAANHHPWVLPRLTVDGIKLGELLQFIRARTDLNIVAPGDAEDLEIPSMDLKNVGVKTLLEALCVDSPWMVEWVPAKNADLSPIVMIKPAPADRGPIKQGAGLAPQPPIDNLDLQGGTLGEVTRFIASRTGANVLLPVWASESRIATLKLRNVSPDDVLLAAAQASGLNLAVVHLNSGLPGEQDLIRLVPINQLDGEAAKNELRVFNVQDILIGKPSAEAKATILECCIMAIDSQRKIDQEHRMDRPVFELHEKSGILLVTGQPADLKVVTEIIGAMHGKPMEVPAAADHQKDPTQAPARVDASPR